MRAESLFKIFIQILLLIIFSHSDFNFPKGFLKLDKILLEVVHYDMRRKIAPALASHLGEVDFAKQKTEGEKG